jgi:hypothetical protein
VTSIKEHERAIPTTDVPEKGLVAGDAGTVVSVHYAEDGEHPAGYTLEFFSPVRPSPSRLSPPTR